jgi:hypothetical protein
MIEINAVSRLTSASKLTLSDGEKDLLRLWFEYGQFDPQMHDEILSVMEKVAKTVPKAAKAPSGIMHRGLTFKQSELDAMLRRGQLSIRPTVLSSWSMSQKIAGDYAKMADQEPGHVGVVMSRSTSGAQVVMYADAQILKLLGLSKADDQKEVIVRGTGLPKTVTPEFVDLVYLPKTKKFVSGEAYMTSRGIE